MAFIGDEELLPPIFLIPELINAFYTIKPPQSVNKTPTFFPYMCFDPFWLATDLVSAQVWLRLKYSNLWLILLRFPGPVLRKIRLTDVCLLHFSEWTLKCALKHSRRRPFPMSDPWFRFIFVCMFSPTHIHRCILLSHPRKIHSRTHLISSHIHLRCMYFHSNMYIVNGIHYHH